jgi:hypothetical protein
MLERYELGTDPEVPARPWPQIQADLDRLIKITHWTSDHAAIGEPAPAVIGELHGAYLRLPQQRREILLGLMNAYSSAMWTTKRLRRRSRRSHRPSRLAARTHPAQRDYGLAGCSLPACRPTPQAASSDGHLKPRQPRARPRSTASSRPLINSRLTTAVLVACAVAALGRCVG